MNKTIDKIRALIVATDKKLTETVPNELAFSQSQASWNNPGVNRVYLSAQLMQLIGVIDSRAQGEITSEQEKEIASFEYPLTFLKDNTIPQLPGSSAAAVPAMVFTIDSIEKTLDRIFPADLSVIQDNLENRKKSVRDIGEIVRSLEAKLRALESRSVKLDSMVSSIESAYLAADKLPATMSDLQESEKSIALLKESAAKNEGLINKGLKTLETSVSSLIDAEAKAVATTLKANEALEVSTSSGLAAAFTDRAKELTLSVRWWVGGLIVALCAGGFFGHSQITHLITALISKDVSQNATLMYGVLSFISVAGPLWFAWLATKNIGQKQRLAEDYGYKASISRAYEGYKKQAIDLDEDFQKTLFASALARLDEQPLRLVESKVDGSPWHAALDSEVIKQAVSTVPNFAKIMLETAKEALSKNKQTGTPIPTVSKEKSNVE
jgi:hypothetical protein